MNAITKPVAGYKVDPSKGGHNGTVSSQWYSRPADQRFQSLDALMESVKRRADHCTTRTVETKAMRVLATRGDNTKLTLTVPGRETDMTATNWSFGQLCSSVSAPAAYLRSLPAPIAAINLQHGLLNHRGELLKTLEHDDGTAELRAVTGPDYGRIYDHELVSAVQKIAGNGTGDTRWKIPGVLDWSNNVYNPNAVVTAESTTLYASDRDVFCFLVDDLNPIEAGKLDDGSPDLFFRGMYCWNSEVGSKTLGLATFYLRAVCQNRNIWGLEDFNELTIRHSKYASDRFASEAEPALLSYADSSPIPFMNTITAARDAIVAKDKDERVEFLRNKKFSKTDSQKIIDLVLQEEGHDACSVYDFVQGITAFARSETHQDARIGLERIAGDMLSKVSA